MAFLKFLLVIGVGALGVLVAWFGFTDRSAVLPTAESWTTLDAWRPFANLAFGGLGGLAVGGSVVALLPGKKAPPAVTPTDLAELEKRLLEALAAQNGDETDPDAARAANKAEAIARTVREEPEAAKELAEGDFEEGFEDLKAAARKDMANAARKWRDIGALAYDRAPSEALAAYRESTALDGSHSWAWIYLARLERLHGGDLGAARAAAETALKVAGSERERGVAAFELAENAIARGNLSEAREHLAIYEAASRTLFEAVPSSASAKRDVSVSLNKLGDVAVAEGDLAAAKAAYQEMLEIVRALSAADPASASARRDLAISYERLGNVAIAEGNLTEARDWFEREVEISQALMDGDPKSADAKRFHSVVLNKLGDVALAEGNLASAKAAYQEGLEIRRALSAADPASAEAKRDVSVSLEKLGDVAVAEGDIATAKAAYQESLDIARTLSAADPASASAKRDVMISVERLGDVAVAE